MDFNCRHTHRRDGVPQLVQRQFHRANRRRREDVPLRAQHMAHVFAHCARLADRFGSEPADYHKICRETRVESREQEIKTEREMPSSSRPSIPWRGEAE